MSHVSTEEVRAIALDAVRAEPGFGEVQDVEVVMINDWTGDPALEIVLKGRGTDDTRGWVRAALRAVDPIRDALSALGDERYPYLRSGAA